MAIGNNRLTWHIAAGEDIEDATRGSGDIFKAISNDDGLIANNGREAIGLITQLAKSGQGISFDIQGVSKYTAGGAVAVDALLTVAISGYLTTAGSGDYVVGRNWDTAASSGAVSTGIFDFSNPTQFETSSAYQSTFDTFGVAATEDLSAGANFAISLAGDFAPDADTAHGVLQANTNSGDTGQIRSIGFVSMTAGDVLTAGQSITVTSGWATPANSGDLLVGIAPQASAAGNSGSTFTALVNFATPHFATNCFDVQY